MPKQKSRSARWFEAAGKAREEYDKVVAAADELTAALSDLEDLRGEYEDWFDNLPENLQDSPVGTKLAEISGMDIESARDNPLDDWDTVGELIDAAENADLPMGFGRD